jgi:PP-loop superfamily ATP-utilizing enzyme
MSQDSQSNAEKDQSLAVARSYLEEIGIKEALLFDHSPVLRIQVPETVFDRALQMRETIVDRLTEVGYRFIALDLMEKGD